MKDKEIFQKGWLAKDIAATAAQRVAHPLLWENDLPSQYEDKALIGGIEILKKRLRMLEGEAHRRGLKT